MPYREQPLEEVSLRVRTLLEQTDVAGAAALLLSAYGADLFGFLIGVLEDIRCARRVYMSVCERAARELAAFHWRCSPRVWLYSLARRELRDRRERKDNATGPSSVPSTEVWRRADIATVIASVRRALSEEERELLILRVDRVLDWHSLAMTQLEDDARHATIASEARQLQRRIDALLARIQRLTSLHLKMCES